MNESLSIKLFKGIQKGLKQLSGEALDRICSFVGSQRTNKESFMDKSGKADIYYAQFGWMLSYILGIRLDRTKTAAYLAQQDVPAMDLIHYAAFMRCKAIQQLLGKGKIGVLMNLIFSSPVKNLQEFNGLPNNDSQSPYTKFVWLSLCEDTGQPVKDKDRILQSLAEYHVDAGGYSNVKNGGIAAVNATSAALIVTGQLTGYTPNTDVACLRDMQDPSGGFRATEATPAPDLLSTATALFVLKCYGVAPRYAARDFVEAHWLDSGGFSATLLDSSSDVEYTFYGLLALGSCA